MQNLTAKIVALQPANGSPVLCVVQRKSKPNEYNAKNGHKILWPNGNNTWFYASIVEKEEDFLKDKYAYRLLKIYGGNGLEEDKTVNVEAAVAFRPQFLAEYYPAVPLATESISMKEKGSWITHWISPAGNCYPVFYGNHNDSAISILLSQHGMYEEYAAYDCLIALGYMWYSRERDMDKITEIRVRNVIEDYQYPKKVQAVWDKLISLSEPDVKFVLMDYPYIDRVFYNHNKAKEIYLANVKSLAETGKLNHDK